MIRDKNDDHCYSCYKYVSYFLGCLLIIGLIGGLISYLVFGIIFLVQDYSIANDCKNSNLWEYALVSIILSFTNFKINSSESDKNIDIACIIIVIIGVMNLCLSIWGGIELWQQSCDKLSDSNLWKFSLVAFILQCICTAICVLVPPLLLCYFGINMNNNINDTSLTTKITNNIPPPIVSNVEDINVETKVNKDLKVDTNV